VQANFAAKFFTYVFTNYGSACGPVIVPVFKTGGRHLRCCRCVRLTHASAKTKDLTGLALCVRSVKSQSRHFHAAWDISSVTTSPWMFIIAVMSAWLISFR
jgi:hypothetical protein